MLCSNCGKHPATVHYQETINGKKTEYYLCEACAHQMQFSSFDAFSLDPFWMTSKVFAQESVRCPKCGLTLQDFSKRGKFGCADCYHTFSKKLPSLLKGIHGHTKHRGKFPKRGGGIKHQLTALQQQMEQAVAEQNFELAAKLRDEIKGLEGGK